MYYEERLINGVMCWRGTPNGEWRRYTLKELSQRYEVLRRQGCLCKSKLNGLAA